MAKTPTNSGRRWTTGEINQLKREIPENTPRRVMAMKHDRSAGAVQAKANVLGLSTKPSNQSLSQSDDEDERDRRDERREDRCDLRRERQQVFA